MTTTIQTNNYGNATILETKGQKTTVQFHNTGNIGTFTSHQIKKGAIRDTFVVGNTFETKWGPLTVISVDGRHLTVQFTNTGYITTTRQAKIIQDDVLDKAAKRESNKKEVAEKPYVYHEGSIHPTKNYGDVVILENKITKLVVQFLNTGHIRECCRVSLANKSLADSEEKYNRIHAREEAKMWVHLESLMEPTVYGIGYLGDIYDTTHIAHSTWAQMLRRCYSTEWHNRFPTYIGCSVCDEWHNFSTFAQDIENLDGYQQWLDYKTGKTDVRMSLDKDLIVAGNKQYSPSTCCFVTQSENAKDAVARKKAA